MYHSTDPLADSSDDKHEVTDKKEITDKNKVTEKHEVSVNVPSNPRRENPVCALCGIAIGPLAPTTEPQDQLATICFCKCADNASSPGHASLHDVPQDRENASRAAAGGLGALTTSELPDDGSDFFDGEGFPPTNEWMEDGGDAARNNLPHGEDDSAGTQATASGIGAETTSELTAGGSLFFAGQDFSWIDQWVEDGEEAAARFWAGGASSFAESMDSGMWSLSYD
jgi:hypothetical protein